ncbi:hypothetical protein BCU68_09035 [Vibrio sp. 10N.286.49.B3]|uniref:acyltransferase n=1 Tax=Vibrio sp. 10N.286.49.B3 TaxID=1880855 RepID=UPI000C81CB09|nr:hypothetical protein [Vibrio sp. 10N.286.49.B3]PMH45930.1 hypothetical protein BCU68_09035 [Vibrio sp. 10N.286.49.B3]
MDQITKSESLKIIDGFDLSERNYMDYSEKLNFKLNNLIYTKTKSLPGLIIKIREGVNNTKIYIGENVKLKKTSISIKQSNITVYIGDNCDLKSTSILANRSEGSIVVGNGVTTTSNNTWNLGGSTTGFAASIIIGDDCMLAENVIIRGADGHPIVDMESMVQINEPKKSVIIEPYTWVGYGVSILKDVRIGACSIIALGSVVTKDVPSRHIAAGIPALPRPLNNKSWMRNRTKKAKKMMMKYKNLYPFKGESDC